MKTLSKSLLKLFRRDGVDGGARAVRLTPMGGSGAWTRGPDRGPPQRRSYPPPVYRRDEDLYIIGENAGSTRVHRAEGQAVQKTGFRW